MAEISNKQLGDALQSIAEQFLSLEKSITKIAIDLLALKAFVAIQANPSAPKQALVRIQELEAEFAKHDPNRAGREKTEQVIEMLRIIEKHGGPKQA